MRDMLDTLWERLSDPYWRADHPELTAALVSVVTGVIGLAFAWLQYKILHKGG